MRGLAAAARGLPHCGGRPYTDVTETLGRRETLSDVLARGGVTGRDYAAFLAAAKSLPVRRLRPGLKFDIRRLKTDRIASRVTVRLSPERRLSIARGEGEAGWVERVETIRGPSPGCA